MTTENEDFYRLLKQKRAHESKKDEQYLEDSRTRLKKISTQKIRTTMIGALSAIEKKFGFLMGFNENGAETGSPLSPEEREVRELYNELRSEILDIGNGQIRNLDAEFEQYEIKWKRYHMTLPIKPEGPTGGQNG